MRPIVRDSETILKILLGCITIVLVVSIVLLASVPPVSRDALTHHLVVPKLYLQHGKMVELPDCPIFLLPDESRSALHTAALFRQRYRSQIHPFPICIDDGWSAFWFFEETIGYIVCADRFPDVLVNSRHCQTFHYCIRRLGVGLFFNRRLDLSCQVERSRFFDQISDFFCRFLWTGPRHQIQWLGHLFPS